MTKFSPLPVATALCLIAGFPSLSHAQTRDTAPFTPLADSPKTAAPVALEAEQEPESITTLLKLDAARITAMDRAYSAYARTRLLQEAQIAGWQEELETAQAATSFDEKKATALSGSISGAENKIATAYLKARGLALNALTSLQRIQLEKLEADSRPILDDKYRFLLLSQVEDLWRTPIDPETGQALLSANAAKASPRPQGFYQNFYPAPVYNYPVYNYPVYDSPFYGFGWNSYNYGYQSPFYARPGFGGNYGWNNGWNNGGYYGGNNYGGYSGSNRRDRNARPRWDRSGNDTRPSPSATYSSPVPRVNGEPRRPLYTPTPSSRPQSPEARRPDTNPAPIPAPQPQWERQRETTRPAPSRDSDPPRPTPTRPDPPREQPRPDPPRSEPPRAEPKRPESGGGDEGSRWDRGGGGRGGSDGNSRGGRGR